MYPATRYLINRPNKTRYPTNGAKVMDAKRFPAHVRMIKDIDISQDVRARVLGRVCAKAADSFTVEDDTGKIAVECSPEVVSRLFDGQVVRVYAQVIPSEDSMRLRAEFVQDATGIDINLYKTAQEMWTRTNQ